MEDKELSRLIGQWDGMLRGHMPLSKYLQINGYLSTLSYLIEPVPIEWASVLVSRMAQELLNPEFTTVGYHIKPHDSETAELFVTLIGGED